VRGPVGSVKLSLRYPVSALLCLAEALDDLGFEILEPDLTVVARWTAKGLTAYDSGYVALAETRAIELITADEQIVSAAPGVARPLSA
jgi:predicted nucleic acid-binding protein